MCHHLLELDGGGMLEWECNCVSVPESFEWFIDDQAFSRMILFLPHPLPPHSVSKFSLFLCLLVCRRPSLLTWKGWGRIHIIRRRENLVLYKSFKTLCCVSEHYNFTHITVNSQDKPAPNGEKQKRPVLYPYSVPFGLHYTCRAWLSLATHIWYSSLSLPPPPPSSNPYAYLPTK
jgi:hypothetical protein